MQTYKIVFITAKLTKVFFELKKKIKTKHKQKLSGEFVKKIFLLI